MTRDRFIAALNAEGIPCSAGYRPLYREAGLAAHFVDYPFETPFFDGVPDYGRCHCPVTERICAEEAVWLTQSMLLGNAGDTEDIAQAIAKVRTCACELLA